MNAPIRAGEAIELPPYPFTDQQDRRFSRMAEHAAHKLQLEDFEHLKSMAGKAFRGVYGEASRGVAKGWSNDFGIDQEQVDGLKIQHKPALEALRMALSKVSEKLSG